MATTLGSSGITFSDNTSQTTTIGVLQSLGTPVYIGTYTTAGSYTWVKPSNVTRVLVKVVGAGGGAAGYCESGGAGGFAEKIIDVSAVSNVTVTVGTGGTTVTYYAAGGGGGSSSFGTYLSASGGGGANSTYAHTGGLGGVGGGTADYAIYGGAGTGHANSMGYAPQGRGGQTYWTGATAESRASPGSVNGGGTPGSGGPGNRTNDGSAGGGVGRDGAVVIWGFA